ncbi:unnamed protein product [Candida verbasci]|uniref:Uncharacterized protein n=1 Tax=Candida verbasci TaxID=1227364 RepID=A0A9W4U156_9ASCO|nr:unnamed protein product [Candida verbasci]
MDTNKIELTEQQFITIFDELFKSFINKLNIHLPSTSSKEVDIFKFKVYQNLQKYIFDLFEELKKCISIQGKDIDEILISELFKLYERVEEFNLVKNKELRELLQTYENEIKELTTLRKNLPNEARVKYKHMNDDIMKKINDELKEIDQEDDDNDDNDDDDDEFSEIDDVEVYSNEFKDESERFNKYKDTIMQTNKNLTSLKADMVKCEEHLEILEYLNKR